MDANIEVRLIHNPSIAGFTTGKTRPSSYGELTIEVKVAGQRPRWFPESQIEIIQEQNGPVDDMRNGKFSGPDALRTSLIHIRLSGRLADMIYSMESTNTDFHAYQFKPVVKIINSPSGGLLIADEVGLGKTIEAGLIWKELQARLDAKNLIVICPLSLKEKWQTELLEKFNIDASIVSAGELLEVIESKQKLNRGGAYICARDSIRPDRGWEEEDYDSRRIKQRDLALKLQDLSDAEPVFDLVVMDEAHHLRNPLTQSHKMAELIRSVSNHAVFLSATPIHLRNRDLFAQLKLLDPGAFVDEADFEALLEANNPVVAARELILHQGNMAAAQENILEALKNPLLADSNSLRRINERLKNGDQSLTFDQRADIAAKLDNVNLLSNLVTRTRRRDVKELAIIRRVAAIKTEMSENERAFYKDVEAAVTQYAFDRDVSHRFLLSTPQRMLTSCMPAALMHWRRGQTFETDESEDGVTETIQAEPVGPLIEHLRSATMKWSPKLLASQDTKYEALVDQLSKNFNQEKVVLFSTFKTTLNYLEERLTEDGHNVILIHGGVKDRSSRLIDFKEKDDVNILLSSEIGSEGLDLQFCKTLLNYDLPWNPMKVEQRIGRVDRFGQSSDFVTIRNFLHKDTIDDRIWERLYSRLQLCEQALGGFEDILGEEIRELENDLSRELTPDEQNQRIEQTSVALENRKLNHSSLEEDAAGLIAHGDYILNKVQAAHEFNRWLTPADLQSYLIGFFAEFYPRSSLVINSNPEKPSILNLDMSCRDDLRAFCNTLRGSLFTTTHTQSKSEILFGKMRGRSKAETVTQQHPLIRFAAHKIETNRLSKISPAIAVKIDRELLMGPETAKQELDENPCGSYLVAIQRWSISGITEIEKLSYAGWHLNNGSKLNSETAESLTSSILINSEQLREHFDQANLNYFSDKITNLFDDLNSQYFTFQEEHTLDLEDKVNFQLRSLERHKAAQLEMMTNVIKNQRDIIDRSNDMSVKTKRFNVIRTWEGKINKLEERISERKERIRQSMKFTSEAEDVAAILIEVS